MIESQPSHKTAPRPALVADDDAAIRALIARVLVQLGLVPVLVGDGAAAIDVVEARRSELACALLDIEMPGANGLDAAHAIQRLAPDLPIMLISGSIPNVAAGKLSRLRLAGTLDKPFSLAALRKLIRHALAQGATSDRPVGMGQTQLTDVVASASE